MMSFEDCLAFALRWEGGYVNDPDDRGGATNQGVCQSVYDEWRTRKHYDPRSVEMIERGEVLQIYFEQYWKPTRCPSLDHPMTLVMFDSAVNHGVNRAIRWLQGAVNTSVDGHFGPQTMQAFDDMEQCHGTIHIAQKFMDIRQRFYHQIVAANPKQEKYLRGWMNRITALRQEAKL